MSRLVLCYCLSLLAITSHAKPISKSVLNTKQYLIELQKDASVLITRKDKIGKTNCFYPKFIVMQREDDPKAERINAHKIVKGFTGVVTIPTWKQQESDDRTADFFKAAKPVILTAKSGKVAGNQIVWTFPPHRDFTLEATFTFPEGTNEPIIKYSFLPKKQAWYSIAYSGMPEMKPEEADAIWQPYVWQEKRFPEQSFLSPEDMCSLPAVMVEKDGETLGLVAEPSCFPYELPSSSAGNLKFGVLIRNAAGKAQPLIFAPLFGTKDSKLPVNEPFSFQIRVLMFHGNQPDAFRYVAQNMFGFTDYRKNVFNNLNQTIENMIDFAMDDVYCGWNADLRGFDYSTDVAQTVKVVSGLHPVSAALITDNEGIYQRRGLPMIEYLMSREKYLFTINKNITRQNASSKMAGPSMEVAEIAALNSFYQGISPVFNFYADSLSRVSRSLNLTITSRGDAWPNLLALYRMTGEQALLDKAKVKADEYIQNRIISKAKDFTGVEQAAQFWTDFAPDWIELLDLYEETKDKRYLDASVAGAKLYMEYIWFYPMIPDKNIIINKDGIVNFRSYEALRDSMLKMVAPKQTVPAWRLSQIGLTPEASNTYGSNPAIFLTHYAAHLLRLAYYSNDDFFRSVARSAVVGRYSNYPGYDINGIFNTVYSRADYPLRVYNQISYNQVYYNHVWPQIALLFDYLISDIYVLSNGNISFPNQFAPGYAYLKSKVYGDKPGKFYGDNQVYLWMPKQVLTINNDQLNYITAYGNGKFYIAFINQDDKPVHADVILNPDLIPYGEVNKVSVWEQNRPSKPSSLNQGRLDVAVAAKGITAYVIDNIQIVTQFQSQVYDKGNKKMSDSSFKKISSSFGQISSAIYSFGKNISSHTWLSASAEELTKATMHYKKTGSEKWLEMDDNSFPFEFTMMMKPYENEFTFWIEGITPKGEVLKGDTIVLTK